MTHSIVLDDYKSVDSVENYCEFCGAIPNVVGLWYKDEQNGLPDMSLCVDCFLSADGRFKNETPRNILSVFEKIDGVNVDESQIEIITSSPFGRYTHIHYTDVGLCRFDSGNKNRNEVYECIELTGESEIFNGEGELVGQPAAHIEIAVQTVLEKNHQQL